MKLILSSPTVRAYEKAIARYSVGVSLHALVGGAQYALSHYASVNFGTAYDVAINGAIVQAIQSVFRFFLARQDAFDAAVSGPQAVADPIHG